MKKFFAIISVLICVILCFSLKTFATEILNEPEFFVDDKVNLSGTGGELNIVPIQAILQGEEIQMTVEESSKTSMSSVVEWSSSNPEIISCTKNGKIKGLLQGKATITVKAKKGGAKDSIVVYCAKKLKKQEKTKLYFPIFWLCKTPNLFSYQNYECDFAFIKDNGFGLLR